MRRHEDQVAAHLPPKVSAYSPLIGIVVPFAAGVFGIVTVSSPFLNAAEARLASTPTGSRALRVKTP
jgi:uncharacterized membrane protein YfcA